ncbi:MAG: hypothetical protein ABIL58_04600 [Pseudomonadota bacterium]
MKSSGRCHLFFMALVASVLVSAVPAMANQIGKVSIVDGDVVIVRKGELIKVTSPGVAVMAGDTIQTAEGMTQITFADGAAMQVNPYSTAGVEEREETSGFAFWKKITPVRRITAYIGKLWFKSGASDRKNFLQTPTAVCGLRGSEADFGTDGRTNFLNMASGLGQGLAGNFVLGVFDNPGISAAQKSALYNLIVQATNSGRPADLAIAIETAVEIYVGILSMPPNPIPPDFTPGPLPAPEPDPTTIPPTTTSTSSTSTTSVETTVSPSQ